MKLDVTSEVIMLIFILGLAFITVIQPTFYPPSSSTSPPGIPAPTITPTPPPAGSQNPAFLTITPSISTLKKGETLTLTLVLDTGDFEIDTVDLVLNFDPGFLRAESATPGTIFPQYPIQKIENGKVQISAAGEIKDGQVIGFKGQGEYARIVFQALEATDSTQVSFAPNSIAASAGVNRLNLNQCQPGNYQITD